MAKRFGETKMSKDILRALMDPSQPDAVPWSSSDLRAILDHQLAAPLIPELDQVAELAQCSRDEALVVFESCGCRTFGEILGSQSRPHRAIRILKEYAKGALTDEGSLPRDVARVLYVAAILRGKQAGITDISSLDDANLEREARRCLTFGWLPDSIRELLKSGLPKM